MLDCKKNEKHTIEYNYIEKHNPYFFIKRYDLTGILKSFYSQSNDTIHVELNDFYTNAEKLKDDIVMYIRNERHLYCEVIDNDHFFIDGKRYILNVTHGKRGFLGQTTILYRDHKWKLR